MMKKQAALGMIALMLSGLSALAVQAGGLILPPKQPVPMKGPVAVVNPDPVVTGTIKLHSFSRMVVDGPFDVELIGNVATNDLRYIGQDSVIQGISAQVRNNTLYVNMNKKAPKGYIGKRALVIIRGGQIEDLIYSGSGAFSAIGLTAPYVNVTLRNDGPVDLRTNNLHLHYLEVAGKGPVNIGNLDAHNLKIVLRGNNRINLKGRAMVENVMATGRCYINIEQLETPFLRVRGRQGAEIHLAGAADVLEAFLYDHALFDGQFLLARKAFVKTFDEARADIQVSQFQSTLASNHSNIFYYRKAEHHADYMHHSGSVLQFDDYMG